MKLQIVTPETISSFDVAERRRDIFKKLGLNCLMLTEWFSWGMTEMGYLLSIKFVLEKLWQI